MVDASIHVKTEQFDGPLGLLLLLIQKQDMNIRDLNLGEITKQYLAWLGRMQELNFDVAGDYLYLAVTLIFLKSKSCLSQEDLDEMGDVSELAESLRITSHSELVKKLERLQHYQRLGQALWGLPKIGHQVFTRPKINRRAYLSANSLLMPVEVDRLTSLMVDVISREKRRYMVMDREKRSVKDKLIFLQGHFTEGKETNFEELIQYDGGPVVDNMVVTFIALLELARLRRVALFQNTQEEGLATIHIQVLHSLDDLDLESVSEFIPNKPQGGAVAQALPL